MRPAYCTIEGACMLEWIQTYEVAFWWAGGASLVVFVAALVIVPLIVVRIPPEYFADRRRPGMYRIYNYSKSVWLLLMVVKNAAGVVLVLAGIAMLVLPGQGVLTILFGIALMNFPGKFQLERWVVSRRPVLRLINGLRRRRGSPPLVLEESSKTSGKS